MVSKNENFIDVELNEPELRVLIGVLRRQIRKDERRAETHPFTPEEGKIDMQQFKITKKNELLDVLEDALEDLLEVPETTVKNT
jgi:hypothetical protein